MSYVECPKCGHRALSVATQCPHCGLDFTAEHPKHPVVEEEVPRLRRRLQVAGVLLVVVFVLVGIALALYQSGSQEGLTPPPATPVDSAPSKPSQPTTEKSTKLADSARQVAPAPRTDTTHPAPPPAPPPGNELLQRYARMWVNVRKGRRPDATIVRVLKPGEPVLVDSLRQQWYRVLIDGRPVGYVYRGYLSPTPP